MRGEPEPEDPGYFENVLRNFPKDSVEVVRFMTSMFRPEEFTSAISSLATDPEARSQVWAGMKDTYGSLENLGRYSEEHPAQFWTDAVSLLTGGAGLAKLAGGPALTGRAGAAAGAIAETGKAMVDPSRLPGLARKAAGSEKLGIPEKLYETAMKIPPGSLKAQERAKVIHTLLREEKLALKPKAVERMSRDIERLDIGIEGTLEYISAQGANMDAADILNAIDGLKDQYKGMSNPDKYYKALDAVKDEYATHAFVSAIEEGGTIPLADANIMKKAAYQEVAQWYKKGQMPETGRVGIRNKPEAIAKAEAAKTIRQTILDHPEVPKHMKTELAREAGLMNARKWVERATNRGGNLDVIHLSGMMFGILVEKGVPGAVAFQWVKNSQSQIAVKLAHGSKLVRAAGGAARTGSLGSFQAGRLAEEAKVE